ncbi:MAG: efflux transporter outer membrane subunit [Chlamydiales bacterium]|nr:efflux transporter outer membrane subunit [Chlamydiales bacterium]
MIKLQKWSFIVLLGLLCGCMVGPNYKPPENTVSDHWTASSLVQDMMSSDKLVTQWWDIFQDPLLNKYIQQSIEHNNDILMAEANILEARAIRQIAASSLFPQIFANINATKTYFSKNGPVFAIGSATGNTQANSGLPFAVQVPQIQNLFNALFDASWEIDLFGKTRRTVEAASAMIGSAIERKNDVMISVMAEIARNYMEVRGYQQQSLLVKENIQLLEQKAIIIQKQLETGYISQINYENIGADLANERALLPDIESQIYRGIYTLSILTGAVPETLVEELLPFKELPTISEKITVGLRSDLLRRRPDVRQKEQELAAATAGIGVAVASFFPTISLSADGGFQSLKIKNLFTAASKTWALGGGANTPLFQGGRLVGNLKAARALASVTFYSYQQTVLQALQETESSLIAYKEDIATSDQYKQAKDKKHTLASLSNERYQKGLVSLLDLLDSKRQLNIAEQQLLSSNTASLIDLITLYKALGGGWEIESANTSP